MGIATELANYALKLQFKDLPKDVVHEAKRALLDTMGCAVAAYDSDVARIMCKVIGNFTTQGESTIIGSGKKTLPQYAALVNGVMTRYWDFNDNYGFPMGEMVSGSHPSEIIPTCLAIGEKEKIGGEELITSIVLGYEISARFIRAIKRIPLENRGWNMDCRGNYITPLVAGRIMGLNVIQLENAFGIAGSRDMILGILDASGEAYTMAKNMRFPYTGHNGIFAAMLAKEGFTGPVRVLEGDKGFNHTVVTNDFDFDVLLADDSYEILEGEYKPFVANRSSHGHIAATLRNISEHDIKPEDVLKVDIYASSRVAEHTGNTSKKYPTNKESADHSAYFLTAVAIVDHAVGIKQFTPERYNDPVIIDLIEKVTILPDKSLNVLNSGGISVIKTREGKVYREKVEYPLGSKMNPMTDRMLEDKFIDNATRFMSKEQAEKVVEGSWSIEKVTNIAEYMKLFEF